MSGVKRSNCSGEADCGSTTRRAFHASSDFEPRLSSRPHVRRQVSRYLAMGRARRASRTPLHNANDIVLKSEKRAGKRASGRADGAGGAGGGVGASWPAALEMTRREANGDLGDLGTERAENLREQYDELDQLLTQDLQRLMHTSGYKLVQSWMIAG